MNAIYVSGLSKEFELKRKGEKNDYFKAVDDISFTVERGMIVAFLGPNGAGKSTTIKMLTTLMQQTSGSIYINGFDTKTQKDEVRKSFGIVFQDPSLDTELTAYENMEFHAVLYGLKKKHRDKQIDDLLKEVGLHDRKNSLVKTFSGGMKRRLEIARCLLHKPKILFLDEPTLGLDTQTRHFLWEHLKSINEKNDITIFLTTHYIDEAEQIANKIIVIDNGRIVANGSLAEIKNQTNTDNLESAYLKLTGENIRYEKGSAKDMARIINRMAN